MIGGEDLFSNSDDELDETRTIDNKHQTREENDKLSKLVISSVSVPLNPESHQPTTQHSQFTSTSIQSQCQQQQENNLNILINGSIQISIRAYEKRGEGINAFIVYKIETWVTNIPGYTKSHFEVWRRFSDFLGLREKLAAKYQYKGIIVPYAPEKSISTLTKTKLTAGEEHSELVDKRSRLLERFLRRLAIHPRLVTDEDVRDFLSFEGDLPKSNFTATFSGNSLRKMFKSVGDTFTKIAFPMDENDRWFEQVHNQVEEFEEMLNHLQIHVENLVIHRRELAQADEQMGRAVSLLASCEDNTALARTLSKLVEIHDNLTVVERHESEQDTQLLAETFQEQLHLLAALKEVFYERVKGWQNWQNQQQLLTKKREFKTRMELSGRNERAAQCRDELKDCENKADQMEKEFLMLSKVIREEYARQAKQRREDVKKALVAYLEGLLESEQRILEHWERFTAETKN